MSVEVFDLFDYRGNGRSRAVVSLMPSSGLSRRDREFFAREIERMLSRRDDSVIGLAAIDEFMDDARGGRRDDVERKINSWFPFREGDRVAARNIASMIHARARGLE